MQTQRTFFDVEQAKVQLTDADLESKDEINESVFCPACERKVPWSSIVCGLCKDCFNND